MSTPLVVRLVTIFNSFVEGYDMTIMATIIRPIQAEFKLSDEKLGLLMAGPMLVGFFGPLTAGYLADKIGRKFTLPIFFLTGSVGLMTLSMATTIPVFVVGRVLTVLSISGGITATSLYISELAPAGLRGSFTCMEEVMICAGVLCAW